MPEPQPDPSRPQSQAQSKPQPQARPDAAVPAGADSYTALPAEPKSPRRWGPAGAAVLAVALAAGWFVKQQGPPAAPAAAVAEQKTLLIGAADLNRQATDALRALPPSGKDSAAERSAALPALDLRMPVKPGAPVHLAPGVPPTSPAPIPIAGMAMPVGLEAATAVQQGEYAIFSLKLMDFADMDGDIIGVSVDGVPMGQFMLTHGGATLDIPLKQGRRQVVRITAIRDGVGGITLGVQSSLGQTQTRVMTPGEFEEWVVDYR